VGDRVLGAGQAALTGQKHVEDTYYLEVSRYSTSGFLRLKLGAELEKRRLSSHMFETRREARRHLEQSWTPGPPRRGDPSAPGLGKRGRAAVG
jgi:hypothetical protein